MSAQGRASLKLGRTWIGLILIGAASGCHAPGACPPEPLAIAPPLPADRPDPGPIFVASPEPDGELAALSPASAIETWIVHTRAAEQVMGSNPWPSLTVARLDAHGGPLHGSEPEALLGRMAGRPSVFLIHGAEYSYRESTKEAVEVRNRLEAVGGLTPETLFVVFDWPSERELLLLSLDLNDKARRSRIAGYHLARFLQASPPGSEICLMGQSDGARVLLTALHLLAGAELGRFLREPSARLDAPRDDLRLRAVILEAAVGHTWLNPGDRLGAALPNCEALLSLRNSGDYALTVFTLGAYTGQRPALGLVGWSDHDWKKLGPLRRGVEEINLHPISGARHTLFGEALAHPGVARRIAAYTSRGDVSEGAGRRYSTRDLR